MSPGRRVWDGYLAALLALSIGAAAGAAPAICETAPDYSLRAPAPVHAYLDALVDRPFDLRVACAHWAGTFSNRHRAMTQVVQRRAMPGRLILFPASGVSPRALARWLKRQPTVRATELTQHFVVAYLERGVSGAEVRELLAAPALEYAEPDCDGPDFFTTSREAARFGGGKASCWDRAARGAFPNDPCIDELWGHALIGWDAQIAARSRPRIVAVLDSGIDVAHDELHKRVVLRREDSSAHAQARELDARCALSGRCASHGTQMAGTIGGRMDNGVGVAGVAPNSYLLPLVITRVDQGHLARLSTIARAIDAAVESGADVINISAKWPVDSRAVAESIRQATSGAEAGRRLLVTGYATSLDRDESVREYYPSQYRCLPGVLAAVPADVRGSDLFNTPRGGATATDGRILAPGVDIVVTTTDNSERGYAMSEAAGASSAAAYVSGVVALVWGSPPLTGCGAQDIKELLFCRSKRGESTRYPWVHVEFLRELSNVEPDASCRAAMEALGCD